MTYTIPLVNAGGPLSQTVYLTDMVPAGPSCVAGSLAATSSTVDESAAPTLYWPGALSPAPVVTVTYGVTVSAAGTETPTNQATIAVPGHPPVVHTAAVLANGYAVYRPLILGGTDHGNPASRPTGAAAGADPLPGRSHARAGGSLIAVR